MTLRPSSQGPAGLLRVGKQKSPVRYPAGPGNRLCAQIAQREQTFFLGPPQGVSRAPMHSIEICTLWFMEVRLTKLRRFVKVGSRVVVGSVSL
jgi:hypothetical protein